MTDLKNENPLHLSWHDLAWIPHLNPTNILDYFSERSNPFYDRTCNNEIIKMQKLSLDHLNNMTGLEYILLHVQEPILFVIRKQHRLSQNQVTPITDYYIIAGYVYQAPDLNSLISFRLTSGIHHLVSAFDEAQSFMRYHPTKGYSWEFKDGDSKEKDSNDDKPKEKQKEEPSSAFQRARVDYLLGDIFKKFFPKVNQMVENGNKANELKNQINDNEKNGIELKQEKVDVASNSFQNNPVNSIQVTNQNNFDNRTQPIEKKPRIS